MSWQLLVRSLIVDGLRAVLGRADYGYPTVTHAALPDRLFVGLDDATRPRSVVPGEAEDDVEPVPSPLDVLLGVGEPRPWPTESRRALARVEALWLLAEDRHRTLDVQAVDPLAHQLSMVEHVARSTDLLRVLIADEVGLGKTVEAGLLIARLKETSGGALRVLYLAPAALVQNVVDELDRLGLHPREWSAIRQEARLRPGDSDPMVVVSLHRAVYANESGTDHFATVTQSGPWDVIIVDEAHHLTDWSDDGTNPQRRLRLVQTLVERRLAPGGRLVMLTGTPHQGNRARFENLLRLLDPTGRPASARGRVIYRTKDDIRDWDGQPLFPIRRVHPPFRVDAGQLWQRWFAQVGQLLVPGPGDRAGAWRRAQALQWCASSPQAGLAFLVRLAIRGGGARIPQVQEAALALRPYRGGAVDEPLAELLARLDAPEDEGSEGVVADPQLLVCLQTGRELITSDALGRKTTPLLSWLDAAPDEKFVVFAQPLETVDALCSRLEAALGAGAIVKISGVVPLAERRAAQRAFREDRRVRVLVSSRAGGEGINLQTARHLVHFDVPWNPMEMEQRVGRVHRYGSVKTIEVLTIVLDGSREERVLARARARLGQVVRDLDPDHFERLFARTMSLIPLEDLAILMAQEGFGDLRPDADERLDALVREGYQSWERTDRELRESRAELESLDRGQATHEDLRWFLVNRLDADEAPGWTRQSLVKGDGEAPGVREVAADVLMLGGSAVQVAREAGIGLLSPDRTPRHVGRVGLNSAEVIERIRRLIGEQAGVEPVRGAGVLRVDRAAWIQLLMRLGQSNPSSSGLLLVWVVRHLEPTLGYREVNTTCLGTLIPSEGEPVELPSASFAELLRLLRSARFPLSVPPVDADRLRQIRDDFEGRLRRGTKGIPARCVFPVGAFWIDGGA